MANLSDKDQITLKGKMFLDDQQRTAHWSGDINDDCGSAGPNCVVIDSEPDPPLPALTDLIDALSTKDYVSYFNTYSNGWFTSTQEAGLRANTLDLYPYSSSSEVFFRVGVAGL